MPSPSVVAVLLIVSDLSALALGLIAGYLAWHDREHCAKCSSRPATCQYCNGTGWIICVDYDGSGYETGCTECDYAGRPRK